jgi:hypothetical protein
MRAAIATLELAALDAPTRLRLTEKYSRVLGILFEFSGIEDLLCESPELLARLASAQFSENVRRD